MGKINKECQGECFYFLSGMALSFQPLKLGNEVNS